MKEQLEQIKMVVLDVDGTMTDGSVYVLEDGSQMKKFNAKDGIAIQQMVKKGIQVGIISHSKSSGMVTKRAEMLGIQHCYVGSEPKMDVLNSWLEKLGLGLDNICFIGDDINDVEIMEQVGLAICPADAAKEVEEISHYRLEQKGGDACIREFYDKLLKPVL